MSTLRARLDALLADRAYPLIEEVRLELAVYQRASVWSREEAARVARVVQSWQQHRSHGPERDGDENRPGPCDRGGTMTP